MGKGSGISAACLSCLVITLQRVGEKGLAQPPAQAALQNGHSAQQRLEGTVSELGGVQWVRTKEVHMSSDNDVSQLRSSVQYDTDAFCLGTSG